jgi:hypothetical protein
MIVLVEWLRSRMPRYPIRFQLPYTDPLSPRVADEGWTAERWPWLLEARRAGLQASPSVAPVVAHALTVPEPALSSSLASLQEALVASSPWRNFGAAADALTSEDEESLKEVLEMFRRETRPEVLDAVEPQNLLRRLQHKHAALRMAEAEARGRGGRVAEYYAAFRRLDGLFDALAAILGQLLLYGAPRLIDVYRASWRRSGGEAEWFAVSLVTSDLWPRLNEVVKLRVGLGSLSGLAVIEGYHVSVKRHGDAFIEDVNLNGVLLPDSRALAEATQGQERARQ